MRVISRYDIQFVYQSLHVLSKYPRDHTLNLPFPFMHTIHHTIQNITPATVRTCYFWLPLWGVTCSLLYLSRTHSKRQDKKVASAADISAVSGDSGFCNPLISSVDHSNHYFFGGDNSHYGNYSNAYSSGYDAHHDNDFDNESQGEESAASQSTRSRPSSRNNQQHQQYAHSFDSSDPSPHYSPHYLTTQDAILRLDSSTVYGSEGQLSGHTDGLYHDHDATDTDTEEAEAMFGAVFSPDNSIHLGFRDSSMFSPATSAVHHMSPKDMRFSTS